MSVLSRGRATAALLAALCAAPVAARPAAAQYFAGATYSIGFPTGDLRDFLDNTSFLGFTFEGRRFSDGPLAFGFLFGYNEFYQSSNETLPLGDVGNISGQQYRHMMNIPILILADWFPQRGNQSARMQPFVGLGAGTYWVRQEFEIGSVLAQADNWQFGVMPEAGVAIPTGRGSSVMLIGRYHIPFGGGDFLGGGSKSFQHFSLGIGMSYVNF